MATKVILHLGIALLSMRRLGVTKFVARQPLLNIHLRFLHCQEGSRVKFTLFAQQCMRFQLLFLFDVLLLFGGRPLVCAIVIFSVRLQHLALELLEG